jgi:hypothetical protein
LSEYRFGLQDRPFVEFFGFGFIRWKKLPRRVGAAFSFYAIPPNLSGVPPALMIYAAKLDIFAKVSTVAVCVLLGVIDWFFVSLAQRDEVSLIGKLILYLVAISLWLVPILTYLYGPIAYELASDSMVIRRRFSDVVVPYGDIQRVEQINETFVQDMDRDGGNCGVFGYYGRFRAGSDVYHLYVTRMRGTVLVTTRDGRRIVISPDSLAFIARLKEKLQS